MLRTIKRVAFKQVRNAARLLSGKPVGLTPLGSLTIERSDVELARTLINSPSTWFEADNAIKDYETKFAKWNGSTHAFAFMSGRVSLSAIIHGLALQPGDEVIVPGYTCVVVPNAFRFAGIEVVYSDIELDTFGLDASCLEEKITPKTRAIMIQHLYGLVSRDVERLLEIADRHGLKVIEDCAQSTGAEYCDQKVGNLGHVGFYSSERSKMQNTIMGGVAVTNAADIAEGIRSYYDAADFPDPIWIDKQLHNVIFDYQRFKHPQRWFVSELSEYQYRNHRLVSTSKQEEEGGRPENYGCRMPSPVAVLGMEQLKRADAYITQRREQAIVWGEWCDKNGYARPLEPDNARSVYLRYPFLVPQEKKLDTDWLADELGVVPGKWFLSNLHPSQLPVAGCPNADRAVAECVNLPTLLK